jgi:ATP-dependent RNA helicase RhlE
MPQGTVKWFDPGKGFGFIEQDESDEDAFVHYSEIQDDDGFKELEDGERVQFQTEDTEKGLSAVDVTRLNGDRTNGDDSTASSDQLEHDGENLQQEPEVDNFSELGLSDRILEHLDEAGFERPRPIQVKTIPSILEGSDLVGTAPTGTGKTAAFILPILQELSGTEGEHPRALILAPTHELADQITEEAKMLSGDMDLTIESVYGGTDVWEEGERLEDPVDILVACPGRLRDHISRNNVKLRDVETFVLDEADRMCDMGFLPEIKKIMAKLPSRRQNLFFSATIPPEIQSLAEDILDNPKRVSVGRQAPTKTISHYVIHVNSNQKRDALKSILDNEETDSVLIFARTRDTVRNLAKTLRNEEYDACALQGGMDSMAREATLSGFRKQSFKILIATNVAARGLDVEHISHVINYDIPEDPDVYTHRIGRTGRSGVEGKAYTFVTNQDQKALNAIENTIGYEIDRADVPG